MLNRPEKKMKIGNYADLRKKLFTAEQIAKVDRQVAAELAEEEREAAKARRPK